MDIKKVLPWMATRFKNEVITPMQKKEMIVIVAIFQIGIWLELTLVVWA